MPFFKLQEAPQNHLDDGIVLTLMAHDDTVMALQSEIPKGLLKPFHSHPAVQIYLVTSGKLEVTIGEETQVLTAGDTALVPPDVPHQAKALEDTVEIEFFTPGRDDVLKKYFS